MTQGDDRIRRDGRVAKIADAERLFFERAERDFPFYRGGLAALAGRQWVLVLIAVGVGFAILIAPIDAVSSGPIQLVPAVLFAVIPLLALRCVTPAQWTALMHRVGVRQVLAMVGFAVLNVAVSGVVGWLVSYWVPTTPNRIFDQLSHLSSTGIEWLWLKTIPQLFGEELLTVLPFLAMLHLFHASIGWSRRRSVVLAWILSSVLFALAHLPTYDWNVVQCVLVIGTARILLTLAYLRTKNIWVSTGAHIATDWSYFGLALIAMR